jgi:hypothetical protein
MEQGGQDAIGDVPGLFIVATRHRTEPNRSINGETNLFAIPHPALGDFQPLSTLALGEYLMK